MAPSRGVMFLEMGTTLYLCGYFHAYLSHLNENANNVFILHMNDTIIHTMCDVKYSCTSQWLCKNIACTRCKARNTFFSIYYHRYDMLTVLCIFFCYCLCMLIASSHERNIASVCTQRTMAHLSPSGHVVPSPGLPPSMPSQHLQTERQHITLTPSPELQVRGVQTKHLQAVWNFGAVVRIVGFWTLEVGFQPHH